MTDIERLDTIQREGRSVVISTDAGRLLTVSARQWKTTYDMDANEVRLWVINHLDQEVIR